MRRFMDNESVGVGCSNERDGRGGGHQLLLGDLGGGRLLFEKRERKSEGKRAGVSDVEKISTGNAGRKRNRGSATATLSRVTHVRVPGRVSIARPETHLLLGHDRDAGLRFAEDRGRREWGWGV